MTKAVDRGRQRLRRGAQTRRHQSRLRVTRLAVHLSGKHTYAQIIDANAKVLASASTTEKALKAAYQKNGGNLAAAEAIGRRLAEKAKQAGIEQIAFDRGGWRYGGRVKALAEAARAGGLLF